MLEMRFGNMIQVRHKTISNNEIVCKSFLSQGIGLMFHPRRNLIMHFTSERIISLHNFFVFYSLEIVILDKHKKVIEIKQDFRPFTRWSSTKNGKYLLELGLEASKGKIKLGDIVTF